MLANANHPYIQRGYHPFVIFFSIQWSFGVTCWEVFTCGRVPYTGVPALTLLKELSTGYRLSRPSNAACSDEMYVPFGHKHTASIYMKLA